MMTLGVVLLLGACGQGGKGSEASQDVSRGSVPFTQAQMDDWYFRAMASLAYCGSYRSGVGQWLQTTALTGSALRQAFGRQKREELARCQKAEADYANLDFPSFESPEDTAKANNAKQMCQIGLGKFSESATLGIEEIENPSGGDTTAIGELADEGDAQVLDCLTTVGALAQKNGLTVPLREQSVRAKKLDREGFEDAKRIGGQ